MHQAIWHTCSTHHLKRAVYPWDGSKPLFILSQNTHHRLNTVLYLFYPVSGKYIFVYSTGFGTKDKLTAIHSTIDEKGSLGVSLDLEKAFELAQQSDIVSNLATMGITGKLLAWSNDYHLNRKARVRLRLHSVWEWHTTGRILSPFLFNLLIEDLFTIQLPLNTYLFAYADDIQLLATGSARFPNI